MTFQQSKASIFLDVRCSRDNFADCLMILTPFEDLVGLHRVWDLAGKRREDKGCCQ